MFRLLSLSLTVVVLSFLSACVHTLEVVDIKDYKITLSDGPRQNVAVLRPALEEDDQAFFDLFIDRLREHPATAQVRRNWTWDTQEAGFHPDVVVEVAPEVSYSGSGWNFLITFPGFLIFTPAWNGLVYHGDIATSIKTFNPTTRELISEETVVTDYSMRHLDFGRGFWAASGWWTPGYGATSLLSAFYNISYDGDATEPFVEKIRRSYGDFIAEKVLGPVVARAKNQSPSDQGMAKVSSAKRSRPDR